MRSWQDFDLVTLVQLPLFLFSATFYPLSTYPDAVQWIVRLTPLYHAIALLRGLLLGAPDVEVLVASAYLAFLGVLGMALAKRRIGKLLLT
jgi:lipooligosaccharide transport system permease protein